MTYKLKGLGLALFAMLALGAFSASAASANEDAGITLEQAEATITGVDHGENPGKLVSRSRTVTCNVGTYHGDVKNLDTSITLTPKYTNCHTAVAGSVATVTNTGCDYLFTLTGQGPEPDKFTSTTDLDCDDGKAHIQIDFWLSKAAHEENKTPTCAYTFSDTHENKSVNQELEGIELTNIPGGGATPKNYITADVDVTGIVSTRVVGSTLLCGALLDKEGTLNTQARLKAENEGGQEVGGTISTHLA
jgi:hypothetical protein